MGRVQTPTLAILVEREDRIRKFVSRPYWELHATFGAEAGTYVGRWFDETFKRDNAKDADPDLKPERVWDAARAQALREKCLGRPGIVTEESKPATQLPPLLFDLTSLQREANSRFGFSAKTTLALAQTLYERHKVLTYPRTDSRHLPEDYPRPSARPSPPSRPLPTSPTPGGSSTRAGSAPTAGSSTTKRSAITSPSSPHPNPQAPHRS
ncbi:MAG: DNA topoisomerase [Verrucomicrobia bacterium]|nr:DNA topoisomerase [Verrucomicrobiota bacterium]